MTRVKICGLKRGEDALAAAEAGASMLGFVFAPSRRKVSPEAAREMIAEVRRRHTVQTVGVFVNEDIGEMDRVAALCGLDYLQLSGEEPAELVEALDRPIIKAIHVGPATTPHGLMEQVAATPAELLLLDTGGPGVYGGTGAAFNWDLIPGLDRPFLLAGGLDAANVACAIRRVRPWGVDVSSGVETAGQKDQARIRSFLRAALQSE